MSVIEAGWLFPGMQPAKPKPRRNTNAKLLEQLQRTLAAQDQAFAAIREELRVTAHERRQTNEKLDLIMRQIHELKLQLRIVETPRTPTISRRRPLSA